MMATRTLRDYAQRVSDFVFSHWFVAACIVAAAVRLPTLSSRIDGPHEWRQCDTASYARNFFRDGIDLFAPSINWLGAHKTLILEFPLPEAVVAVVYHLLWPSLIFDRLVYLAFFAGAAIYLYHIVRLFHDRFVAQVCVTLYCFLPLSLYYSRAIHIDFAAVFFAHAFLYHAILGYRDRSLLHLAITLAAGIIAFLVKVPYVFYLVLPLAVIVLARFDWRWAGALALVMAVTAGVFGLWRLHVDAVNAQIPDLSFLPKWYPFVDRGWWYYGTLVQRLNYDTWKSFLYYWPAKYLLGEIGIWLVLMGMAISALSRRYTLTTKLFFFAWTVGIGLNVVIFFNLHLIMHYYQIPVLAFWAYYIAIAADFVRSYSRLASVGLCAAVAVLFVHLTEGPFFWPQPMMPQVGDIINKATPKGSLVIAVDPGASTYDYPCTLYHSDRFGWAVNPEWFNWELFSQLKGQGATHLALRTNQPLWEPLHNCDFCGRPLVERQRTPDGSVVSVFQIN